MPIAPPLHRTLIADGPAGAAGEPLDYLAGTFRLDASGMSASTLWRPATGRLQTLEAALAAFRAGTHDGAVITALQGELRQLVETGTGCFSCALDADRRQEVVLSCQGDARLLTDLPWEMLPVSAAGARIYELVEGSLANRPFVRGLNATVTAPPRRPTGRLRILPCIANPPLTGTTGSAYSPVDLDGFANTISQALRQFPQIEMVGNSMVLAEVTTTALRLQIEQLRPHLLLIVAHGSSAGHEPELIFADKPMGVRSLAAILRRTLEAIAGFLISCDTSRTPAGTALAAASTLTSQAGLSEVVVMQGKIEQDAAQLFLRGFLTSLLVQRSLAMAVADGRMEMKSRPHAFFPTIFRNLAAPDGPALGSIIDQYEASLRQVAAELMVPPERLIGRPQLGRQLERRLGATGLLRVEGPFGSGKTTLLKRVLADMLAQTPARRPVFYVDCRSDESNLPEGTTVEQVLAKLSQRVNDLAKSYPNLLPDVPAVSFAGVSKEVALLKMDQWQAIVVLDHVQIPSTGPRLAAWNRFVQIASTLTRSLVVITQEKPSAPETSPLSVPFFNLRETREFATLNRLGPVSRLHAYTGGAPVLLTAVRDLRNAGTPVDLTRPGLHSARAIGRVYARTFHAALSGRELEQLARVFWLEGPVDEGLLRAYVLVDDPAVIDRFRALGLLVATSEDEPGLLTVPEFVRATIPVTITARDAAADFLYRRLVEAAGDNPAGFVRELFDRPGGTALILGLQRAALHLDRLEDAENIAFWALPSRFGATPSLHRLFATAHHADPRTAEPGISIHALRLSAQLGLPTVRFERDLARRKLTVFEQARFRVARATALKDRRQTAATQAIWADLNYALTRAESRAVDRRLTLAERQDWQGIWAEALEKKIHMRLFIELQPTQVVAKDLRQLLKLIGPGDRYGNALASLIECEMKVGPRTDWRRIAAWLEDCDRHFQNSSNHRYLGYLHYQRGQYYRKKPNPDLPTALRWYAQSEQAERLAGEPRRWGLALLRRIEIGWGQLHEMEAEKALEAIDEAVAHLYAKPGDSLTLRVLQRLFALQAKIELQAMLGPGSGALEAACAIGAAPQLHGTGDVLRFRDDCRRCLLLYVERASMEAAAEFVRRFAAPIRRKLGARLSAANIEDALTKLSPTTKA